MRGQYDAVAKMSSIAASKSLMMLTAPSAVNCRITSVKITTASTLNQQLEATFVRVTTVGSAAGTSVTPTKGEPGDQASGATVIANLTAEPTTYSSALFDDQGFSSQAGYFYQPIPEERPLIAGGASVGLRMISTPSSTDFEVAMSWIEEG